MIVKVFWNEVEIMKLLTKLALVFIVSILIVSISSCSSAPVAASTAASPTVLTAMTPTPAPTETVLPTISPEQTKTPEQIIEENLKLDEVKLSTYNQVMKEHGVKEEDRLTIARLLYLVENPDLYAKYCDLTFDKIWQIARGEKVEGVESRDLPDGGIGCLYVHCDPSTVNNLDISLQKNEKAMPGFFTDMVKDHGVCIVLQEKIWPKERISASFDQTGMLVLNVDKEDIKAYPNLVKTYQRTLMVESLGVKWLQLGGEYTKYTGYGKSDMMRQLGDFLFKTTKDPYWEGFSDSYKLEAEDYANSYGLSPDDPHLNDLVKNVMKNNWVKPYGAKAWQEIAAVNKTDLN
jgi:uncharacterized lipoprotein YehR (DUF1307 family)